MRRSESGTETRSETSNFSLGGKIPVEDRDDHLPAGTSRKRTSTWRKKKKKVVFMDFPYTGGVREEKRSVAARKEGRRKRTEIGRDSFAGSGP